MTDASNFVNKNYEGIVKDIIGDTFYVDTSYRGKIAKLRQFAEIVVRKLLDIDPSEQVTIGNKNILKKIKELNNGDYIQKRLTIINKSGRECTHTKITDKVTESEYVNVLDAVMDLLSVLLINYFDKYKFGSNKRVMSSFSILPPIMRFKVLSFLYEKDPQNIDVIDKLVLSILKSYGKDKAVAWVEERKDMLIATMTITEEAYCGIVSQYGEDVAKTIQKASPANMYQLCMRKISEVGKVIESKGKLYDDFENALTFYRANGILQGDGPEIIQFNDIMNFIYLGRKEAMQKISDDSSGYIIMNFISE